MKKFFFSFSNFQCDKLKVLMHSKDGSHRKEKKRATTEKKRDSNEMNSTQDVLCISLSSSVSYCIDSFVCACCLSVGFSVFSSSFYFLVSHRFDFDFSTAILLFIVISGTLNIRHFMLCAKFTRREIEWENVRNMNIY